MSLLAPWALAGLLLTVPLVLLHLRHRRPPAVEVPSLLLAGAPGEARQARSRRWGPPPLPLLLALQVLVVVLLVVALAEPSSGPPAAAGAHVAYVVDGSVWMTARAPGATGDRIAAARAALRRRLAALPGDTPVTVVLAGSVPRVVFRGGAGDAAEGAARTLVAGPSASTLPAAVALAADTRAAAGGRVVMLHAPEDPAPRVRAAAGVFTAVVVGPTVRDRGFMGATARCGLPAAGDCEVLAQVRQTGGPAVRLRVAVTSGGRAATVTTADLPAGPSSVPVVLRAPPGARLRLSLPAGDALAGDDRAWIAVPAATAPAVTIVAAPDRAGILQRAFAAVPGARVHTVLPARYRPADARDADLLVLDAWAPPGGFPGARSVLYVDPPRLPEGRIAGTLRDGTPSGSTPGTDLLAGVDLDALTPDPGTARRIAGPSWLAPVAWSPSGPLLLAGDDGRHRVAALALDPAASPLPQSEAFPLLAANLVRWAQEWIPEQTTPGGAVLAQVPAATRSTALAGRATADAPAVLSFAAAGTPFARQAGTWGVRTRVLSSNVDAAATAAGGSLVDLRVDPAGPRTDRESPDLAPWLLLAAFLVLGAEWLYAARMRARGARA